MKEMNKSNNNKKSLFTCFKLATDEDDSFKSHKRRKRNAATTDPVLAYLAAANEDGVVLFSKANEECRSRRRKRGRDTWHALRMALNDTLMKKILSRWKTKKESMSISNSNAKAKIIGKRKTTRPTNSNTSSNNGGSSVIFTSSSSLTSTSSSHTDHVSGCFSLEINNMPIPPPSNGTCGVSKKNSVEDRRKREYGLNNISLCMLVTVSLLVLILWGKFFAILCNLVWLCLVPFSPRRKYKERFSSYKESEFDSDQYKKKIIIEEIHERSHNHTSLLSYVGSIPTS